MNDDSITRLLLLGILLCLIALVAQGFGATASETGRYTITGMRAGAPVLIRTDSVTGETWKLELRGGGGIWEAFLEPGEGDPEAQVSSLSDLGRPEPAAPPAAVNEARAPAPPREAPALQLPPLPARPVEPRPAPPLADEESIDSFLKAAVRDDLPPEIRIWAVGQLGQSDDPRSTEALLAALESGDDAVRSAAAEALEGRDDPRVAEALAAQR